MSLRGRTITIVIHRDNAVESRTYRIPVWRLRAAAGLAGLLLVLVLAGVVALAPLASAAARLPGMRQRVAELEAENAKVQQLAIALDSVEARYDQVRRMVGAEIVPEPAEPAELPVAPPLTAATAPIAAPTAPPIDTTAPSLPHRWPLAESGYVTQGQIGPGSTDEAHPGLDIAVPIGTGVRASGGGTVAEAGEHPEYGRFVLLDHPNGYQTMYGHLSRATAQVGDTVMSGQVVGLSGNSGRSTAPHLHFEIRRNGRSVDPRTMVKEGS